MSYAYQPLLAASAALQAGGSTYTLTADAGMATVVGQSAQAKIALKLAADKGIVSFGGQDIQLARALRLPIEGGNVAVSGQQADFLDGLTISAVTANISVSGYSVSLAVARTIAVEPAAFSLDGVDASLSDPTRILAVDYGGFSANGQQTDLPASRYIEAAEALFGISGPGINIIIDAGEVPPTSALNFGLSLSL